jgi:ribonuclease E
MTFTEAAVEVLRRVGKPLHFKEIADQAVRENLLSHVGQDPEVTMGQRLAAMAKREEERKVVAVAPEGTFALLEWAVPQEAQIEPVAPPLQPPESAEPLYRPREREPRPIHAQARRRLAELQAEHEDGHEEVEAERRKQDQLRQKGQRRFPPPAEVVFEALAQRQTGAPLIELAQDLIKKQLLSEGLVSDLPSLVAALLEDNRRRTEAGRKPVFIVDGERVTLVEFPPPAAAPEPLEARGAPHPRPMSAAQLVAEGKRAVCRALKRRVMELETAQFEQICSLLLDKMGMRDVRVAKRSKEGPLYLARQRRGVSDLRVAVKLLRGPREIGRADVQELRRDLAHYSAQMGLVLAPGEAGREARGEASAAGQAPVALYVGEALPEEMIALRVGVTVQTVEVPDVDEGYFAALGRPADQRRRERDERPADEQRKERDERPEDEHRTPPAGEYRGEERSAEDAARDQRASAERDEHAAGEHGSRSEAPREEEPAKGAEPEAEAASAGAEAQPAARKASEAAAEPPPRPAEPETPAPRDGRKRRGKEERPRATSAAEQAWGQPAGTMRFAPPAGPTVASPQFAETGVPPGTARAERASAGENAAASSPESGATASMQNEAESSANNSAEPSAENAGGSPAENAGASSPENAGGSSAENAAGTPAESAPPDAAATAHQAEPSKE